VNYGITLKDLINLYDEQGGKCALCHKDLGTYISQGEGFGKGSLIEVDHDHSKSGRHSVRGLLCGRDWRGCNRRLGYFEDIDWLRKALAYLEDPPAQHTLA
jgi:hypothetical protein